MIDVPGVELGRYEKLSEIVEPVAKKMFEFTLTDSDLKTDEVFDALIKEQLITYAEAKAMEKNPTKLDRCRGIEHLKFLTTEESYPVTNKIYNVAIIKGAPSEPIQRDMMDRFHGILKKDGIVVVDYYTQRYNVSESLRKQYSASFIDIFVRCVREHFDSWNVRRKYKGVMKKIGFGKFNSRDINNHYLLLAQKD